MSSPNANLVLDNKSMLEDLDSRLLHLNAEKELLEELKQEESKEEAVVETQPKKTKVTLLSGFLGAGKTTLLKRILRLNNELEDEERLKMAVIVNDMGEINLDAEEIKSSKVIQEDAEMVEMHNGCICCTLRGDLLKTVKSLSEEGHYDYLVIESTGIGEPLPVAQTFVMDVDSMTSAAHNHEEHKEGKKLTVAKDEQKALFHYATLDTLVTVVDALNVYEVLDSMQTLADKNNVSGMLGNTGAKEDNQNIDLIEKYPGGKAAFEAQKQTVVTTAKVMPMDQLRKAVADRGVDLKGKRKELVEKLVESLEKELLQRLSASAVDDRSIAKLWLDQIEFANVIVVSKAPQLLERNGGDKRQIKEIEKMVKKLNPLAQVVIPSEDKFGDLDVSKTLINTGLFDMDQASSSASWARELESEEHNPETLEYGISSFTFVNADMPLHPERFHAIMQNLGTYFGALQINKSKNVSSDTKVEKAQGGGLPPSFRGIVRTKGQIWLANCHAFPIGFQTSGRHVDLQPSEHPFLVEKQGDLSEKDQEAYKWMIKNGWWTEKWGDRHSRLVFIGVDLHAEEIRKALNKALLTQEESEHLGGPKGWSDLKDPFYNGKLKQMNASFHQYMANQAALKKQHAKLESEIGN